VDWQPQWPALLAQVMELAQRSPALQRAHSFLQSELPMHFHWLVPLRSHSHPLHE